jgi:hypothetical protein
MLNNAVYLKLIKEFDRIFLRSINGDFYCEKGLK